MKRSIIILILYSLIYFFTMQCADPFAPITVHNVTAGPHQVFGRSFMFTRPAYEHLSMREHLWHMFEYPAERDFCHAIQTTLFMQKSFDKDPRKSRTSRYFLINGKNVLLMAGDDAPPALRDKRDLRAEWFNLPSNFSGELNVNPQQFQAGFFVEYVHDLEELFGSTFFCNSFFSMLVTFVHVENNLNLCQFNIRNPGTTASGPHDIIEAFKQPNWLFDRIDGERVTNRFAELRLRMSRLFFDEANFQLAYYTCLVIPTTPEPNPAYLFNAYAGNGQHVGLNGGVLMQISLSPSGDPVMWSWFINLDGTFLVRNKQLRTFDLRGKPWSRFLLFNTENDPAWSNLPGVNVLTIKSVVRPFGMFDFSTGIRCKTDCFELECGYNVWGHDQERVELNQPFVTDKGIAAPFGPDEAPKTASESTIFNLAPADPVFVPIRESDIDLHSAAAGSALNHKVHVAGGLIHETVCLASFIGAGGFVDFAQKNAALDSWGVWFKFGCSF